MCGTSRLRQTSGVPCMALRSTPCYRDSTSCVGCRPWPAANLALPGWDICNRADLLSSSRTALPASSIPVLVTTIRLTKSPYIMHMHVNKSDEHACGWRQCRNKGESVKSAPTTVQHTHVLLSTPCVVLQTIEPCGHTAPRESDIQRLSAMMVYHTDCVSVQCTAHVSKKIQPMCKLCSD